MYRPKTTLEQWRILQAVVDCGGYAHAAQKLNKSQSSLNHAVAKLQTQLGLQLLEVKGRKAFLTQAGEVLLRRSRHLSKNVEDLESLAQNITQEWEPSITLARDIAFPLDLLNDVLQHFYPHSRGSRMNIVDTVLTGTEEAISQRWADIVLTTHVPAGFLGEPIAEVTFVPVCHPEHPLAQGPTPVDPNELAQHLQIVIKDSSSSPQERHGWLKAEARWTVCSFNSALDILSRGLGFCWLPAHEINPLLSQGKLHQLSIKGSGFRRTPLLLVNPDPDNMGPGTKMLNELFLANRQVIQ